MHCEERPVREEAEKADAITAFTTSAISSSSTSPSFTSTNSDARDVAVVSRVARDGDGEGTPTLNRIGVGADLVQRSRGGKGEINMLIFWAAQINSGLGSFFFVFFFLSTMVVSGGCAGRRARRRARAARALSRHMFRAARTRNERNVVDQSIRQRREVRTRAFSVRALPLRKKTCDSSVTVQPREEQRRDPNRIDNRW